MGAFETFRAVRWLRTLNLLLQAVLFLSFFAGLNYVARSHAWRFDLTRQQKYSLSPERYSRLPAPADPTWARRARPAGPLRRHSRSHGTGELAHRPSPRRLPFPRGGGQVRTLNNRSLRLRQPPRQRARSPAWGASGSADRPRSAPGPAAASDRPPSHRRAAACRRCRRPSHGKGR